MNCKVKIPNTLDFQVGLPVSKSLVARKLIINALAHDNKKSTTMRIDHDVVFCDDSKVMETALKSKSDYINVGDTGTAMRFLTAFFACCENRTVTLDGSERMRQRPIGLLVDTLRQMGANINYLGNEGFPPLKITGKKLNGGSISIRADVSSQFVSALLMIAPLTGGMTLTLEGEVVSRPYIDMTINLMRLYGIEVHESVKSPTTIMVPAGHYAHFPLEIEGDWSAASYWFALKALLPQSHLVLSPLTNNSLQGDRAIVEMMEPLGVRAMFDENGTVALFTNKASDAPTFYERDMAATPDLVPTLAVTLCLLRIPFILTGVATLHIKESDRVEALRVELAKLGYRVECEQSTMSYDGNHTEPPHDVLIDPHGDHRIAMAMSLAATRHHGITIKDAEVVTKSYPNWWEALCFGDQGS